MKFNVMIKKWFHNDKLKSLKHRVILSDTMVVVNYKTTRNYIFSVS